MFPPVSFPTSTSNASIRLKPSTFGELHWCVASSEACLIEAFPYWVRWPHNFQKACKWIWCFATRTLRCSGVYSLLTFASLQSRELGSFTSAAMDCLDWIKLMIRAWCWKSCHPALPTWYCNTNHTLPDRWHDSHTLGPNLLFQSCQMKELWLPVTKSGYHAWQGSNQIHCVTRQMFKQSNIWLHGGCTEIVRRPFAI